MNLQSDDRKQLDRQRGRAARFFCESYSREMRYLKIFARDFSEYQKSSEWLKSDEAKNFQRYYDFLLDFEQLKDFMKQFRWSKEFLAENGIDFTSLKKLYFAVA